MANPNASIACCRGIDVVETHSHLTYYLQFVTSRHHQLITKLAEDLMQDATPVDVVSELGNDAILIDIRHPSELELKPLDQSLIGEGVELLQIPFYKLRTTFDSLDRDKRYFLYCDKGMMSKLHAANLSDEGHDNVGVFSPPD